MSVLPVVVIGAAGFGREVLDVLAAVVGAGSKPGLRLLGVVDDAPSDKNLTRLRQRGVTHLGSVEDWLGTGEDAEFVIGVGHPAVRRQLAQRCQDRGREAVSLVHPTATLGFGVQWAAGVVVCAGVQVSNEVRLGMHTHLNPNATIGHDSVLGDYVSVNPGAIVSGECQIDEGSLIGAGAVVLQQRRIGAGAVVGAASCVTRDVPPGTTVVGVPAR